MKRFTSIVLCVILMLVTFGSCSKSSLDNTSVTEPFNLSETDKVELQNHRDEIMSNTSLEEKAEVKKLNASKDIVYTSFNATSSEYSFELPTINIDSADAQEMNAKIQSDYMPKIDDAQSSGMSYILYIKYDFYVNDNILSLVIDLAISANNEHHYDVYNLDIYTGKTIDNTDLLKYKNIDEASFLNTLTELYKNKFDALVGANKKIAGDFYTEQYDKTLDASNCNIQTPMFLNSNNIICVVAKIYAIAGGDFYYYILNTDTNSNSIDSSISSEYVLPDSDKRLYEISELKNLPADKLQLAINEIYARHGYVFKTKEYADYFLSKSWYNPDPNYIPDDSTFNSIEIENIARIKELE